MVCSSCDLSPELRILAAKGNFTYTRSLFFIAYKYDDHPHGLFAEKLLSSSYKRESSSSRNIKIRILDFTLFNQHPGMFVLCMCVYCFIQICFWNAGVDQLYWLSLRDYPELKKVLNGVQRYCIQLININRTHLIDLCFRPIVTIPLPYKYLCIENFSRHVQWDLAVFDPLIISFISVRIFCYSLLTYYLHKLL